MKKIRALIVAVGLVAVGFGLWQGSRLLWHPNQSRPAMVATLRDDLPKGKNVVWSAAFPIAWKTLEHDFFKSPVTVPGAKELCDRLNASPDFSNDVPRKGLMILSGPTTAVEKTIGKHLANNRSSEAS